MFVLKEECACLENTLLIPERGGVFSPLQRKNGCKLLPRAARIINTCIDGGGWPVRQLLTTIERSPQSIIFKNNRKEEIPEQPLGKKNERKTEPHSGGVQSSRLEICAVTCPEPRTSKHVRNPQGITFACLH